jgi:hypothetical protein
MNSTALAERSSGHAIGLQAKAAAQATDSCALRSKHQGVPISTSTPKAETMRATLRAWGKRKGGKVETFAALCVTQEK